MSIYVPLPLADAWEQVIRGGVSPQVVLGDFLDDWRRAPDASLRMRMVRTPIRDAEDHEQHRWACFLAATVEFLTVRGSLPTPSWVYGDQWTLLEPWFLIPHWKLRAWLLVATPPPWKRRRIFGGDESMIIGRV